MRCRFSHFVVLAWTLGLAVIGYTRDSNVQQHLRDQYQGKTLLLRGFYSAGHLRYDASGMPLRGAVPGDWTADGFVLVNGFRFSHKHLIIQAQRVGVFRESKEFLLRPVETTQADQQKEPVRVDLELDLGPENSVEQFDAALSKIFLTPQDHIADLVPDYWKPCVPDGLIGRADSCRFSQDLLTVPGVASAESNSNPVAADSRSAKGQSFHVGNGVSPPRVAFHREPEFSERARQVKYQGTVTLGLTVGSDGVPTNIRILSPLGAGLDDQAVRAVEKWKFDPAEKDGQPVPAQIAVEVDFHLY